MNTSSRLNQFFFSIICAGAPAVIAVSTAFAFGALVVGGTGQNPIAVYGSLLSGSLVGWPNFAVTLQSTTPLIFTGLAVAVAFRSGIWNIGVEGQMLIGGLAAGVVGYAVPIPTPLHIPVCIIVAMAAGALWALIPAFLRIYLGVNELVVCLMLNPVAALATSYVSARVLKEPGPTNKLPDILASAHLANFTPYSQLNSAIFIAAVSCLLLAIMNRRTIYGFHLKIIGLNPRFASYGGINVRRNLMTAMLLSGSLGGLAGAEQILGVYGAFYDNFSPGYGFDGVAVAMLANSQPLGILASALLFGALNSGSSVLQMELGVSKYLVLVLQFTIVLILSVQFSWRWLKKAPQKGEAELTQIPQDKGLSTPVTPDSQGSVTP
ncbi:ABC transporter permease [Agrobacterium rosae]|uniref:ABC transporter permease n=1 Tax=Agrobacterium rosae TaxID=1972867 RepID=A0AAW9FQN1_9HYPH|nr:ABC transporter permease [Agrobacterium rosae]MDX8305818.1 ABC transporter permease [Agrobacterium rosae]